MLDKNNKELDRLFRSKLQNNEVADNKWNVPPLDVFENALSEIEEEQPKKKRRWPLLFLFGFGFMMLGGIGYLFYQNQSMIVELDKKIEVLNKVQQEKENTIIESTPKNNTEKVENNSNTILTKKEVAANIATPKVLNKKESKNNKYTNKKSSFESIRSTTRALGQSVNEPRSSNLISNSILNSNLKSDWKSVGISKVAATSTTESSDRVELYNANLKTNNFILLNNIPTLSFQIHNEFDDTLPIEFVEAGEKAKYKKEKDKTSWSPYLLFGAHASKFKTSFPIDASVTNEVGLGGQIGLGMTQSLSDRWSLDYSIAFRNMHTSSNYNCELIYDKSEEGYNNSGELVYNMDMVTVNPMYSVYQRVEMPVAENEMEDGDIMLNDTKTKLVLNILSAKAGARYRAVNFGKFDLYLNGGLGANTLLKSKDEMNMKVMFGDKVMMDKTATTGSSANVYHDLFLSGYLGVQLDYKLNNHFAIGLNSNYEQAFKSFFVHPMINQGTSKLNGLNASLRVGYNF